MLNINFNHSGKSKIMISIIALILVFLVLKRLGVFDNKALKTANYWEQIGIQNKNCSISSSAIDSNRQQILNKDGNKSSKEINPNQEKTDKYYIITGSFTNSENANSVARQLSNNGYSVNIIKVLNNAGNEVELVSINTFNNKKDADEFLLEFKNNFNSEAWIYHNYDNF